MPVHIGQMTTELVGEPAQTASAATTDTPAAWAEQERYRRIREQQRQQCLRTRANGFDD